MPVLLVPNGRSIGIVDQILQVCCHNTVTGIRMSDSISGHLE